MRNYFYILVCLLLGGSCYAQKMNIIFSAYLITNNVSIEKAYELQKLHGAWFSQESVKSIEQCSVMKMEEVVSVHDGKVLADDLHYISYAKENDNFYDLVHSDMEEGFYSSLHMEEVNLGGIFLNGNFKMLSVLEREIFQPFSSLRAGYPKKTWGVECPGKFFIPKNKFLLTYFVRVTKKREGERYLTVAFLRYKTDGEAEEEGPEWH